MKPSLKPKTSERYVPMIYAFSTPQVAEHDGWLKIGYTERDPAERVREIGRTIGVKTVLEWSARANFDDRDSRPFNDHDFHRFLVDKKGVEREQGTEWFRIDVARSEAFFNEFRKGGGIAFSSKEAESYVLRDSQRQAVEQTLAYAAAHPRGKFLWNAKPRFGKTLAVYELVKRLDAKNVLVLTNRPAVANSWYDDYAKFLGTNSGYFFVSDADALKNKTSSQVKKKKGGRNKEVEEAPEKRERTVQTAEEFEKFIADTNNPLSRDARRIEFVSFQDLKGGLEFGGRLTKRTVGGLNRFAHIVEIDWDLLVIDESHEGVDTEKTARAFDRLKRKFTLHLSGTPFKALANNTFEEKAIFNWTYADEQKAKRANVDAPGAPYQDAPQLCLYSYVMSDIVEDKVARGMELDGENVAYNGDLNEFFATDGKGRFRYDDKVDRFLDALTTQEKFPFSTPELRDEIKHSFWLLDRVDSAKALARKLKSHPTFQEYEIVLAAGDGKLDEDDENEKAFDKVRKAISENDKTITLSVGQLTTGVTIREWTAVLMLSNVKSPSLYMQAAFRAQNPWLYQTREGWRRKTRAYVFDFDPARTLTTYEKFANDLYSETSDGRGDADARRENVREALNFFPVVGEDESGEMIELDAEKILSIPVKLRSQEVVRSGFMSNCLFQNIANVFCGSKEIVDIIKKLPAADEPKAPFNVSPEDKEELCVDENGEVNIPEEIVIGAARDLFGAKIYDEEKAATITKKLDEAAKEFDDSKSAENALKKQVYEAIKDEIVEPILDAAEAKYGGELSGPDKVRITKRVKAATERVADVAVERFMIDKRVLERDRNEELEAASTSEERREINEKYDKKARESYDENVETLNEELRKLYDDLTRRYVEDAETEIRRKKEAERETTIKDRLRGFSRTIPSFLMAYGDEKTTLRTFDKIIPPEVFKEVTGITVDEFVYLRDGGERVDSETGIATNFKGGLFDGAVFDASVKEFLRLKRSLANYFDENAQEDIFDYIPPQRTNQIFTPKAVVIRMVDALEKEDPGCFDRDDKTFADLYMKSGLYVAEIVKRLYRSPRMKELYPDGNARLRHIFANQVYGLAPTEIIYQIAKSYVLGFDAEHKIARHNLRRCDVMKIDGDLEARLDAVFASEPE